MKLLVLQNGVPKASLRSAPEFRDDQDAYVMVWIDGSIGNEKAIWGVDSVQAFTLGMKLIEELTGKERLDGDSAPTDWRIEVA